MMRITIEVDDSGTAPRMAVSRESLLNELRELQETVRARNELLDRMVDAVQGSGLAVRSPEHAVELIEKLGVGRGAQVPQ